MVLSIGLIIKSNLPKFIKRLINSGQITLSTLLIKKNVIIFYLPTKHQRALEARSKVSVHSRSNWNLEMLVFVEVGKLEKPEKNPRSKDENQQQTQPTYDTESGNQTQATLVGGECSHHCAISASKNTTKTKPLFLLTSLTTVSLGTNAHYFFHSFIAFHSTVVKNFTSISQDFLVIVSAVALPVQIWVHH